MNYLDVLPDNVKRIIDRKLKELLPLLHPSIAGLVY